jgi:hypothetical protein
MKVKKPHRPAIFERRGIVLAAAVACVFLSVILSAGLATSVLARHRQLQSEERQMQAAWLAESALARAAARLQSDAQYSGETWLLSAEDLGGRHAGKAIIAVAAEGEGARRVTVEVLYPDDPVQRVRVVKEAAVAASEQ